MTSIKIERNVRLKFLRYFKKRVIKFLFYKVNRNVSGIYKKNNLIN